jgi:hypothetical protein
MSAYEPYIFPMDCVTVTAPYDLRDKYIPKPQHIDQTGRDIWKLNMHSYHPVPSLFSRLPGRTNLVVL